MPETPPDYDDLATLVAGHGLILRGGFHPVPSDEVPDDPGTLVLVGNAGPNLWQAFAPAAGDGRDPLDAWTKDVLDAVADVAGATALYPFGGPPYLPFQRWAQKAEPVRPSPLGVLIHPEYGLWHAYRGALAFAGWLDLPAASAAPHPCDACAEKPCLSACPVEAFGPEGYDVPACAGHLRRPEGEDCMALGCRARRACPVGLDYVHEPAQAEFHMRAFLGARDGD